jgi:hypothetical protein
MHHPALDYGTSMGRLRESWTRVSEADATPRGWLGQSPKSIDAREEPVTEARRHRPTSELCLNDPTPALSDADDTLLAQHEARALDAFDASDALDALQLVDAPYFQRRSSTPLGSGFLTDDLRTSLWGVIQFFLFSRTGQPRVVVPDASDNDDGQWATSPTERPAVRRVWSSPPISGDPARIPEDISQLLEGWFSLVEPGDVYAFVETVHESLEAQNQPRFATACNAALERGLSDHRFVVRRLIPVASKVDITTIEKALAVCTARGLSAGVALEEAILHLASKPEPDSRSAIQEAVRSVELAAFALTGERYLTLEDALTDLRARGIVDAAAETVHRGLFAFATSASARQTTIEGARRVLVMSAGFVSYLATRA